MSIQKEFRDFLSRGNAMDLAIGVIIGAAFGKIVTSLVEDIIMPPIGLITGNLDFSNHYVALSSKIPSGLPLAEAKKLGPVIAWGNFVTVVLYFLIISACIFAVVKGLNTLKKKEEAKPAEAPKDSKEALLLTEIRDLLKSNRA